jgi:hypothetical protein
MLLQVQQAVINPMTETYQNRQVELLKLTN